MANASQLYRLADHIKLSLLERQRAKSLKLAPGAQDAEISRSMDSLRDGLEQLEAQAAPSPDAAKLRAQYNDLHLQFTGSSPAPKAPSTLTTPNDPSLASDFSHAASRTRQPSSSLKRQNSAGLSKSVRFSDNPAPAGGTTSDAEDAANRAALFPYRDDPDGAGGAYADDPPDHAALDNEQIHAYHSRVLAEQDEQLDVLGASVGRQHELSIQIGDELDEQNTLLEDVEGGVVRHQSQLDRARDRVGKIARKAKDNLGLTIIGILICILVLLIIVLK